MGAPLTESASSNNENVIWRIKLSDGSFITIGNHAIILECKGLVFEPSGNIHVADLTQWDPDFIRFIFDNILPYKTAMDTFEASDRFAVGCLFNVRDVFEMIKVSYSLKCRVMVDGLSLIAAKLILNRTKDEIEELFALIKEEFEQDLAGIFPMM